MSKIFADGSVDFCLGIRKKYFLVNQAQQNSDIKPEFRKYVELKLLF